MLQFELAWLFYLLPLPIIAYWLIPAARQQQAAVRVPFYKVLSDLRQQPGNTLQRSKFRLLSLAVIWTALITAAASPTWIGDPITLPSSGRDLLLAVDLSGSMKIEDMVIKGQQAQRIIAVKAVLNDFIPRRRGDRLGLLLFGSQAYVQAPLTFDLKTVQQFLREAQIGFAGEESTAIGDAIGLAVKRLRNRPGDRHVMILLTDGQNNGGEVEPIPAAKLAAENNIVIYTVGVGADEMITPGIFGSSFGSRRVNPSADLDEKTLQAIAKMTNGKYFRARNPEELMQIYQILDQLEPVEDNEQSFRPQKTLFYWPLAIAFLLSGLIAISFLPWGSWFSSLSKQNAGGAQ
jgi:Ca-activated chloride channel family protein